MPGGLEGIKDNGEEAGEERWCWGHRRPGQMVDGLCCVSELRDMGAGPAVGVRGQESATRGSQLELGCEDDEERLTLGRARLQFPQAVTVRQLQKAYVRADKIKYKIIKKKNRGNLILLTGWTDEEPRPMRILTCRFGRCRIVAIVF